MSIAGTKDDRKGIDLPVEQRSTPQRIKRQKSGLEPTATKTEVSTESILSALVEKDTKEVVDRVTFSGQAGQIQAFSQNLQDFPVSGYQYVAMSSGQVSAIAGQAPTFQSTNMGGIDIPSGSPEGLDAYDVGTLRIELDLASVEVNNPDLSFKFMFGSEEPPTFWGSSFQDFFTVKVYNESGDLISNIARLPDGKPFTVDNAKSYMNPVEGDSKDPQPPFPDPNDVVFNSCTDTRTASIDLSQYVGQEIAVEFQIGDASDGVYDSGVFLDSFQVTGVSPTEDQLQLGPLTINFDDKKEVKSGVYRVNGANINNFMTFSEELRVNTNTKTITSTSKIKLQKINGDILPFVEAKTQFSISIEDGKPKFHFTEGGISKLGFELGKLGVAVEDFNIIIDDPEYGNGISGEHLYLELDGINMANVKKGLLRVDGFKFTTKQGISLEGGKIEIKDVALGGGFTVDKLALEYNLSKKIYSGEGELSVPHWLGSIEGSATVEKGVLSEVGLTDSFGVAGEGLRIIHFPTPAGIWLQKIGAKVTKLNTSSPEVRDAELDLTVGPELEVEEFKTKLHILRLNLTANVGKNLDDTKYELIAPKGDNEVTVFIEEGRIAEGEVKWAEEGKFTVSGELNLFNIITGHTAFAVDDKGVRGSEKLQISPPDWPVVGAIPSATQRVGLVNWTFATSVPVFWKSVSIAITPNPDSPYTIGCKWNKGIPGIKGSNWAYIGCNLDQFWEDVPSPETLKTTALQELAYEKTYTVPEDTPQLLIRVEGSEGQVIKFDIINPNDNVITPTKAKQNSDKYGYRENSTIGESYYVVRNPQAGQWKVDISSQQVSTKLAPQGNIEPQATTPLKIQGFGVTPPPSITMTDPGSDTSDPDVNVEWNSEDPSGESKVDLFYTDEKGSEDGTLIAGDIPDEQGQYTWNTEGTPPGTYYIYGVINDGSHGPTVSYAPGKVTVSKEPPKAQASVASKANVGGEIVLDGSGSIDSWNEELEYNWNLVSQPSGSAAGITQPESEKAYLVPDEPGEYTVQLRVEDPYGLSDKSEKQTIEVLSSPASLVLPDVGYTNIVGNKCNIVATVTDGTGDPIAGVSVNFEVTEGPHKGKTGELTTGIAGKANISYKGKEVGIDTIKVWTNADSYYEADPELRAEIGLSWQKGTGVPQTELTKGPGVLVETGSNVTFGWTGYDYKTSSSELIYSYKLVGKEKDWSNWTGDTSVTYTELDKGTYTFKVKVKDKDGNVDPSPAMQSFEVVTVKEKFLSTTLDKGYNLFSPPGEPQETDPQKALGDDIAPLYMYRWDPKEGKYDGVADIKLKAGEGYWLYVWNDNTQIDLDVCVPIDYSIDLSGKGWQMVGTPFSINWGDVKVDGIKVRNDTSDSSYAGPLEPYGFTYDEEANDYLLAEPDSWSDLGLNGWEGYWIRTTESDVELSFDKGDSIATSVSALRSNNREILVDPEGKGVALPPPPPMQPSQVEGLQAIVSPTLVRDSGGVTFTVRSDRPVSGLQVEVLALDGQKVWSKKTSQSELNWDTEGVANGIYFYTVSAKVDGEFQQAGVGKLLVLK